MSKNKVVFYWHFQIFNRYLPSYQLTIVYNVLSMCIVCNSVMVTHGWDNLEIVLKQKWRNQDPQITLFIARGEIRQ